MIYLTKPSRGHITQWYGARQVDGNPHAGQDYAYRNNATGEIFPEVYAAADGVVLFAGDARGLSWPNIMYLNPDFNRSDNVDSSAGNYTILAHNDAAGNRVALTGYGHQEEIWVSTGQTVRKGQRIGTVGQTGFSAGKHLHFDLVLYPFDVDDAPYYGRVDPNPHIITEWTYSGDINQQGTTTQEDELSAEFERDVRAQLESDAAKFEALDRDLRAQLDGLPALDRDLRADLSQKGQQITALTSTTEALAGLVGHEQGLDIEQIKQAVTEAIAAGLTITVEAGK